MPHKTIYAAIAFLLLALANTALALEADITTQLGDNKTFYEGNKINLLISLSEESHVLIIYQTTDQRLYQIFPNNLGHGETIPTSTYRPLYSDSQTYHLPVTKPFGKEKVWLFASNTPLARLKHKPGHGVFREIEDSLDAIKNRLRSTTKNNDQIVIESVELETGQLP
jgi:hypothetical protein